MVKRGSSPSSKPRSVFGGSKPAPARAAAPPPAARPAAAAPAVPAAAPAPAAGGMMSGLGGALVQGMAWGTGTAIANRAVDAVMGGRTVVHEHRDAEQAPAAASSSSDSMMNSNKSSLCSYESTSFNQCMKDNNNDVMACSSFLDTLKSCQQNSKF